MTINEMLSKVKRFERVFEKTLSQTCRQNKYVLLQLQKEQLLSGLDSHGDRLTPTYSNDTYFLTTESRQRYIDKKVSLESEHESQKRYNIFPKKSSDTPNLTVTNRFHDSLRCTVTTDTIKITSNWSRAPRIEEKYPTALGINNTSFYYFWEMFLLPDLIDKWNNT